MGQPMDVDIDDQTRAPVVSDQLFIPNIFIDNLTQPEPPGDDSPAAPPPDSPPIALPKRHVRFQASPAPPSPHPAHATHPVTGASGPSLPIIDEDLPGANTPSLGQDRLPFQTRPNTYGLYRVYLGGRPSLVPDAMDSIDDVADAPSFRRTQTIPIWSSGWSKKVPEVKSSELEKLFPNKSVYLLMKLRGH